MNSDTEAAWKYHNETRHSWESIRMDLHYLDWSNLPLPFKIYRDRPAIPLPGVEPITAYPALAAIADSASDLNSAGKLTLVALNQILHYSAGITRERPLPGGTIAFRAAACAGALYPIEVYVVSRGLDDLAAGVYHFNPRDRALVRLREGDYSAALDRATASMPEISAAPTVLVFTAITWRSAWKYRSRAYRYHYWDNGMILSNALAVCAALNLPAKLVMGFVDDQISRLVGVDGRRELPLSLLTIGSRPSTGRGPIPKPSISLADLNLETVPLSGSEIEYPLIPYMHLESSLADVEEVQNWRSQDDGQSALFSAHSRRAPRLCGESPPEETHARDPESAQLTQTPFNRDESAEAMSTLVALRPHSTQTLPTDGIGDVIQRRGSTRRFARKEISFEDLSTIIDRSTRGIASDFAPGDAMLNEVYIIVSRVEGLTQGAYYYRRDEEALELLKRGDFSKDGSYLTLEQDLGGDSSATLFYMVDLDRVLDRLGNRGYRAAQMEAGIIGGKSYIAAYALRRGATGLTFYDDDVTAFFSPHAAGKRCMLVISVGVPGRRPLI